MGFTTISSELEPRKVSDMLDRLFLRFDQLAEAHDVHKVETIGDAWMVRILRRHNAFAAFRQIPLTSLLPSLRLPTQSLNLFEGRDKLRERPKRGSCQADCRVCAGCDRRRE